MDGDPGCPALGVGSVHSESYYGDGYYAWCGSRRPGTEDHIVTEAIRLRKLGIHTIREIATKLGVSRDDLIKRLTDAGYQI